MTLMWKICTEVTFLIRGTMQGESGASLRVPLGPLAWPKVPGWVAPSWSSTGSSQEAHQGIG